MPLRYRAATLLPAGSSSLGNVAVVDTKDMRLLQWEKDLPAAGEIKQGTVFFKEKWGGQDSEGQPGRKVCYRKRQCLVKLPPPSLYGAICITPA